jgi:aminocarboxymuconate-semialdehyde decarboxylase
VSRSINVGFADMAAEASGRHVLFATVPMQDSTLARRELDFAVENLAARGMAIASNIEGRNLDDPEFLPIFRHAADLGLPIFIHPSNVLGHDRLTSYYLENLIGNPVDTAAAVASLIFGGVLDLCPDLRFILCHGGGVVPALMGRWAHGYRVRPEPRANINLSPETYLSRFYYDTITHDPVTLRALIDAVSDANVVLGSDYPFDMGDPDPVGTLRSVKDLSDTSFHRIAGGNAAALLGLEVVTGA